jgi:hypothetical protein
MPRLHIAIARPTGKDSNIESHTMVRDILARTNRSPESSGRMNCSSVGASKPLVGLAAHGK